ncbi:hypothetical protein DFH05DRAFT_1458195 [Lentinula detonsa]|uniref:Uncharacterized protein n=1 Tax=Lentinula detonsa TaxID=2804962 RepID=A0A9W8P6N3_9AGAR|nr:hypothetical protein DFH05DRAFT_1458195 [Lentinula detonsa]
MAYKWTEPEVWKLINLLKSPQNFKVLYGHASEDNSSGDTKHVVHLRIATALFEESALEKDKGKIASRVKNKITWLENTFKKKVKELKKTGNGVEEYYQISATGPDHDTEDRAKSIWERIVKEFKYFPDLYRVWCTKPNLVPICATTGVGPNGGEFVLIQQIPDASQMHPSPSHIPSPLRPSSSLNSVHSNTSASSGSSPTLSENAVTPLQSGFQTPAKENAVPASSQRGPRSSAFSSLSFSGNTNKTPSGVPPKPNFEDKMIGLQKEMMEHAQKRADNVQSLKRLCEDRKTEDQRLKRCKLLQDGRAQLFAEFQAGIWDQEAYHVEQKRLDEEFGTPKKRRRFSRDWDESRFEEGGVSGEEL